MARKLTAKMTLDELEDEVLYSRAAIKADPNAQDYLSKTDTWMGKVDDVRTFDRQVRETAADVDAGRVLSDEYLDTECEAFGDDLLRAVKKDRSSRRWLQFFSMSVSRFCVQALSAQVEAVQGWLGLAAGTDDVLDAHRDALNTNVSRADKALIDTRNLKQLRGTVWQRREQLAAELTAERDALREALAQRARDKGLSRTWPDAFFRTGKTSGDTESGTGTTQASGGG